jgi:cytochrome c nitrite reductase small subunit
LSGSHARSAAAVRRGDCGRAARRDRRLHVRVRPRLLLPDELRDHFAAWSRSSHGAVAVCNDCHTPPGLVPKYVTKARNGFWHSFYFTTGAYPDPLQITARNHEVAEQACRTCHGELTESIEPVRTGAAAAPPAHATETSCTRCHDKVGHIE